MNENEYPHNTRDTHKGYISNISWFPTTIYPKPFKYVPSFAKIFILIHTFSTSVNKKTIHR